MGAFIRRPSNVGWEVTVCLYEESGAEDGGCRGVCTKEAERRMGGVRSFVRSGLRKVYRLFPDTSVEPLEQHGGNALFPR